MVPSKLAQSSRERMYSAESGITGKGGRLDQEAVLRGCDARARLQITNVVDQVLQCVEPLIAGLKEAMQVRPCQIRMPPSRSRGVESVEIGFGNQAAREKIGVLFRAWNGAENIERSDGRSDPAKRCNMLENRLLNIVPKSDDVTQMRTDPIFATHFYDLAVFLGVIVSLAGA